ncbi:hypothetical protein HCH_06991 [Hahella chejuensis KCTC 2396]|uniref:Uncharacterized protein n=1 Tax=Hahella chejuensis (strain KCTC 2396) TaxID=349521 RepID=Q2S6W9_HAHCH|nr:hypothetical protein HCH_06991 [Hahella chejuensis KCTC 2396]
MGADINKPLVSIQSAFNENIAAPRNTKSGVGRPTPP